MAANFQKTFEFKVKRGDLERAVEKLFKEIKKVDLSVDDINKGVKILNKELKESTKELTKAAKASSLWEKSIKAATKHFKGFDILGKISGNVAKLAKNALLLDVSARSVKNLVNAFGKLNNKVDVSIKSLNRYRQAVADLITNNAKLVQSLVSVGVPLLAIGQYTPQIYNLGKAFRQLQYDIRQLDKVGRSKGFRAAVGQVIPKGNESILLGNLSKWAHKKEAEKAAEVQSAPQLTGQTSEINLRNVRSLTKALENNKKIQEGISAFTFKHVQAVAAVKKSQFALNLELLKTRTVQAAVTGDIWAAKKAWSGLVGVIKGATGILGGLLGGKAGKLGQAAGVIGISRSIEVLSGQLNRLNIHWLDNASAASTWVRRVTEGVASVTIAYTGFEKLIGAASWTLNAISGFKKWESQAALSIRKVNRQVQNLYTSINAMWWMLQGKGGSPAGVAASLNEMRLGGAERREEHRFASQGPTDLQNLQRDLDLQATKLQQRNLGEADYIEILQRQKQIKLEMLTIEDQLKTKRIEAGVSSASEQFKDEYDAFKDQVDKKTQAAKKAANDITKLEKQEAAQRNKLQAEAAKNYERLENNKEKRAKQRHRDALKRERDIAAATRRRRADRREAMGRIGENLMLGAGFPLLFGGGAGAVGGGVLGAGIQAATGSKGFGAQILFSALGQQVDAFVGKISTLGKAFNTLNPDVDAVIGSLGETNTVFGKHLEMLKKIKGEKAAMDAATAAIEKIIGKAGLAKIKEFGQDATDLGNEWAKVMLRMQASVAALITRTGILKKLAESMAMGTDFQKANLAVITGTASPELMKLWKAYEKQNTRMGALENTFRNTILRPLNKDGSFKYPSQAELRPLIGAQYREDQKKTAPTLLGPGADKTADLEAQRAKLEQIFHLGEKQAAIEEKIKNMKEDGITLTEKEYREKLNAIDSLQEMHAMYKQISQVIKDGMVDAIWQAIEGTKTLGQTAASVFRQIAKMMINYGITNAFGPKGLGWLKMAKGGPVKGDQSYIVGERGPELFTPKHSGRITPNHQLGGSNNVVVNVDASGGTGVTGDDAKAAELGRLLSNAVQDELVKQKRPGGILTR